MISLRNLIEDVMRGEILRISKSYGQATQDEVIEIIDNLKIIEPGWAVVTGFDAFRSIKEKDVFKALELVKEKNESIYELDDIWRLQVFLGMEDKCGVYLTLEDEGKLVFDCFTDNFNSSTVYELSDLRNM